MKSLISDSLCLQALSLPRFIKQEDGSRDQCVRAFNDMDEDNSGVIDRRKFLMYLDRLNDSTLAKTSGHGHAESDASESDEERSISSEEDSHSDDEELSEDDRNETQIISQSSDTRESKPPSTTRMMQIEGVEKMMTETITIASNLQLVKLLQQNKGEHLSLTEYVAKTHQLQLEVSHQPSSYQPSLLDSFRMRPEITSL
jgi:hypothetical protein